MCIDSLCIDISLIEIRKHTIDDEYVKHHIEFQDSINIQQ